MTFGSWRRSPRNRWPARFRVNGGASAGLSASRGAACERRAAQAGRPSPARRAARPAVSPRTVGRRRLRWRRRRRVNRPPPHLRHRGCDALPRQPPCASPWPQARPRQRRPEHAPRLAPLGFAASSWPFGNCSEVAGGAYAVHQAAHPTLKSLKSPESKGRAGQGGQGGQSTATLRRRAELASRRLLGVQRGVNRIALAPVR